MVPTGEQADAVGTNERTAVLLADVEDLLFQQGTLVGLFAEACRYNNERAHELFLGQIVYIVGAEACCHDEYGEVGGRQFLDIVEGAYALHFVLFRVDDAQRALVVAAYEVSYYGTARLVSIVRASDDNDTLRLQKLLVNHSFLVII